MPSPWIAVIIVVGGGAAFTLLTRRVANRLGRSPKTFRTGNTAHDFVGRVYHVAGAILFAFMILHAI